MMIRVSGVAAMPQQNYFQQQQNEQHQQGQMKFYPPTAQKEEVKQDFGFTLDLEIKKLQFDVLV